MGFFPFTYNPDHSVIVNANTEDYLKENKQVAETIETWAWIYHGLHDAIPTTMENLWSGHQFPFRESWEELQISYTLCHFGLYKQAMCSLRSVLELGLLSVYYNINDLGHETVKKWLASRDSTDANTPYFSSVWKILISHPNVEKFQDIIDIKKRVMNLSYLHNYIHTKGQKFSNQLGLLKSNSQTFEIKGFENWLAGFKEIVLLIVTLHILKYPTSMIDYDYSLKFGIDVPSFPHMRQSNLWRLKENFPPDFIMALQKISDNDDNVKDFKNWIDNHEDMSEEDLEKQIVDMDRREIVRQGFESYLRNQFALYRADTFEALIPSVQERVKKLEFWAKENNHYEDKFPDLNRSER
ncbi:hypothetical protein [Pedobacter antarcticus]|uniref:hypothetical protein n=1 Tax=Pedobacter antarcticus TaxID=34086 RepID=UPI0029316940|nr:hypothetical protein [Pedobacter antarcticus]